MFRGNQSLYGRNVVEVWGQSNTNGGSLAATELLSQVASNQMGTIWARHSRYNGGGEWKIDTTFGPIDCRIEPASLLNPTVPTYGLVQPMAHRLQDGIPALAVLQCGYGSTDSAYWSTNYADPYAIWCAARYAQLTSPTTIAGVLWQFESDIIGGTMALWQARWEAIIAARRAAVGNATMPWIVVRPSDTLDALYAPADVDAMQAAIDALVAADSYAYAITDNAMTFFGGPDVDGTTLRRVALAVANQIIEVAA